MNPAEKFFSLLADDHENEAAEFVASLAPSPVKDGLTGYCHYNGIGRTEADDEAAFDCFERGAAGGDSLSLYHLGLMCDRAETPDQREGGPRQKYDHYDAETFMERCADGHGMMEQWACLWLGEFYADSARGGDPEIALEYYERADSLDNDEAAGILAQYYTDRAEYEEYGDPATNALLLKWQQRAYELNHEDESYNYGRLLYEGFAGIPPQRDMALQLFEEDWEAGHSSGARALALHYEAEAREMMARAATDAEAAQRVAECRVLAQAWHERADENAENDFEPEQIIEED